MIKPHAFGLWNRLLALTLAGVACLSCATGEQVDLRAFRAGLDVRETRRVRVRAVFRGFQGCAPCPTEGDVMILCQPCVSTVRISETADSPEDEILWMVGSDPRLVVGRSYTFSLRVRPGYLDFLSARDANPISWGGPPRVELLSAH